MGDEVFHLIERAEQRGRHLMDEPRARAVSFDRNSRLLSIELEDGCTAGIPVSKLEGLADASSDDLSDVEILGRGIGLHWERLDIDFSVPGLLAGAFGTKKWLDRQRAAQAGAARSARKAKASALNGAKGGRPRKRQATA